MSPAVYDIARTREAGRPVLMSLPDLITWIVTDHRAMVETAAKLALSYVTGAPPHSGSDIGARMAVRLSMGMSVERAASREYAYRWNLALGQWVNHAESRSRARGVTGAWPAPHLIGQ